MEGFFQQYLVDTKICVKRDRMDWIKYSQKTIMGEKTPWLFFVTLDPQISLLL